MALEDYIREQEAKAKREDRGASSAQSDTDTQSSAEEGDLHNPTT